MDLYHGGLALCSQVADLNRCAVTLALASLLLRFAIVNLTIQSFSHIVHMGFGAVNAESILPAVNARDHARDLKDTSSMSPEKVRLLTILITNSPQPLLSFLFLTYNSLYTCMLMVQEWFDYTRERKHLRVTNPAGQQRSTYRLQLPYKYGIPLMILSGVLHWLVSQSMFLVVVEYYHGNTMMEEEPEVVVGYSCIAILSAITLGSVAILTGILMGFRRYSGGAMPLAGSSSAAISAACHQPSHDRDAAEKPLLWGVPENDLDKSSNGNSAAGADVGHCCFTSLPALPPVEGRLYA